MLHWISLIITQGVKSIPNHMLIVVCLINLRHLLRNVSRKKTNPKHKHHIFDISHTVYNHKSQGST